jgi:hypothetical protein
VASHTRSSTANATSQYSPDHFTAQPSPSSTPVASRHQRTPSRGPYSKSPARPCATTRVIRARTSSRSTSNVANAAITNTAENESSMPIRDCTCESPSQINRIPARPPSIVERVSRRAARIVSNTVSTPHAAALNRQPKPS